MQVQGVQWAVVSFANKSADVWGDASAEALIDAVETVGFEAKIRASGASPEGEETKEGADNGIPAAKPDHRLFVQGIRKYVVLEGDFFV